MSADGSNRSGPAERADDERWHDLHENYVTEARAREADVLIVGDDHIALLEQSTFYRENIAPLHCLVFGSFGDTAEQLLWRLENGELELANPKVILISIGHNDYRKGNEFLSKLRKIVDLCTQKHPEAKIFVMKLFPMGKGEDKRRKWIQTVNDALEGTFTPAVNIVDVDMTIIGSDGSIDRHLMFDYFHLTQEGYAKMFYAVHIALTQAFNP